MTNELVFSKLNKSARVPEYKTKHAAGLDVYPLRSFVINPGKVEKVYTGISVRIPDGCYGRLAPRSSLSLKGLSVEAGVIDRDYSGEIIVLVKNTNSEPFSVDLKKDKDFRICQLIVERIERPFTVVQSELPPVDSDRLGGFGSTNLGSTDIDVYDQQREEELE